MKKFITIGLCLCAAVILDFTLAANVFAADTELGFNSYKFYISVKAGALNYLKHVYPYLQRPAEILAETIMIGLLMLFFAQVGVFGAQGKDMIGTFISLFMMAGALSLVADISNLTIAYTFVTSTMEDISGFFLSASNVGGLNANGSSTLAQSLGVMDMFFIQIFEWANGLIKTPSITNFEIWLFMQQVIGFLVVFGMYAAMYIKFLWVFGRAVMTVYLLFLFSPFMAVMVAFKKTRGFTMAWIKSISTFMLLVIMSSMVMGMSMFFISQTAESMVATRAEATLSNVFFDGPMLALALGCGLCFILLHSVNELVTSLGGARTSGALSSGLSAIAGMGMAAGVGLAKTGAGAALLKGGGMARKGASSVAQMYEPGYRKYSQLKGGFNNFMDTGKDQFGTRAWQPGYQSPQQKLQDFQTSREQSQINQSRSDERYEDWQNSKQQKDSSDSMKQTWNSPKKK